MQAKPLPQSNPYFNNLRRAQLVRKLHQLGPRAMAELLNELAFDLIAEDAVDATLERYAALDPEIVRAFGGDQFPPAPIHEVG